MIIYVLATCSYSKFSSYEQLCDGCTRVQKVKVDLQSMVTIPERKRMWNAVLATFEPLESEELSESFNNSSRGGSRKSIGT